MFVSSCNTFCYKFHPGNRLALINEPNPPLVTLVSGMQPLSPGALPKEAQLTRVGGIGVVAAE